MKGIGKPCDGERHARFDEEKLETCVAQTQGWRLHATDGGGQAVPPIERAAWRANFSLYHVSGTKRRPWFEKRLGVPMIEPYQKASAYLCAHDTV